MKSLPDLVKKIIAFRDARDWKQFHNPKDMAISLSLEASEVLEHFQWKNAAEVEAYAKTLFKFSLKVLSSMNANLPFSSFVILKQFR